VTTHGLPGFASRSDQNSVLARNSGLAQNSVLAHNFVLAWSLGLAISVAALVQCYAGLRLLALYGDGAYCLRVILSSRRFSCIEGPREATQILLESTTVAAVRSGLFGLDTIAAIFSLSLQLMPLVLMGLCCAVLWRRERRFALFPALHYFAGSSGIASNQILEGPTTAAYFWLVLSLLLFRSDTAWRCRFLVLAAIPAAASHEEMVFLAPLLTIAAWMRASRCATPTTRRLLHALAVWFLVVAGLQFYFILNPVHLANRNNFIEQMLAFKWLFASEVGINVPAILGLLAGAAILIIWVVPRSTIWSLGGFFVAAVTLSGASLVTPIARGLEMQFFARDQPAVISFALAPVGLWLWRYPDRWRTVPIKPACVVLLILAFATSAVQVVSAMDWVDYVTAFRAVLHDTSGVVAWESMLRTLPSGEAPLFMRMVWGWTNPDLSLLLADHGVVGGMIANPVGQVWQPWDPGVPAAYPHSVFWHFCESCSAPPLPGGAPASALVPSTR
jgi:hypothetical protein